MQNFRIAIPYIICLGVTSLFMTQLGARPGLAQGPQGLQQKTAVSGGADGAFGDPIGLRSSVVVGNSGDRGFRGGNDASRNDPGDDVQLDGDLGAQYEAAMRRIEPPRDGDLGTVAAVPLDRAGNEPVLRGAVGTGLDVGQAAIERISTARDTTPSPYLPLGIRAGSFRIFPEVTLSEFFTDNVQRSSGVKDSDVVLEMRPSVQFRSNWSRHMLEGGVSLVRNFHKAFNTEDAREFSSNLRGRIDVTRRTNIAAEAAYSLAQQSRGTAVGPQNAVRRPDVQNLRGAVAVNHRFNRLSIRLRGEIEAVTYDDAVLGGGVISVQSDRDNVEKRLALRGSYEFDPGLSVFAEGLVERRGFDRVSPGDGISRDADGLGIRGGIIFDNGSKLYGEIALGYVSLRPDDGRLEDIDGVSFDASVSWRPSALTTLTLNASTAVDGTTVAGSAGTLTHAANFRVQHELLRHFILTGQLGFANVDYKGTSLVEQTFRTELGAEYIFSREAALLATHRYEAFSASQPGRNYTSNILRVGMRFRR